jgi:membrane protein
VETLRGAQADGAFMLAAALSFYTAISLAPLVTLSIAAASVFYGEQALRGEIVQQIESLVGPSGAQVIQDILIHARKSQAGIAGIVSLAILLFGASAIFLQLQQALNTVWDVALRPKLPWTHTLKVRGLAMAVALGVGFLLLAATMARAGVDAAAKLMPQLDTVVTWTALPLEAVVVALVFTALFKFLPDAVILWRDAWIGGIVTAVLFEIGRFGLGIYFDKAAPGSTYGASGALVVLLLWIYYSALILLLGAEFSQTYARHCGTPICPSAHAYRLGRTLPDAGQTSAPAKARDHELYEQSKRTC